MNRRKFLSSVAGGLAASALPVSVSMAALPTDKLVITDFALAIRCRAERTGIVPRQLDGPLNYLKYCLKYGHSLGAGGMQCGIGTADVEETEALRDYLEANNMFIVGSVRLPHNESDVERFDAHIQGAKRAGADVVRIAIGRRRYEQADALSPYKAFVEQAWKSLQLAGPVASKHQILLAVENHKDFRVEQMLGMLEKLDSKVGVCVDTNNSYALLSKCWACWRSSTVSTWVPV